jgi:EAL domain-containing protein (putative c-di-GMP-specific phosphodiesterase class I)
MPDAETMSGSVSMARDLRAALDSSSLDIAYQLQWDLAPSSADPASVRPVTVEALCRWRHPVLGDVPPDTFIPVAEDHGFLDELDLHILGRAAGQVRAWRAEGYDLGLAANSSPTRFTLDYAERIVDVVRASGLEPEAVTIEITETPPPQLRPEMRSAIEALHSAGVAISVDDFDGALTTITLLESLPVDEVKIDRRLIQRADPEVDRLIAELIDTGSRHGWRTVAEGIETAVDLERARQRHCDRGQGYLWGQPVPAGELTLVLAGR